VVHLHGRSKAATTRKPREADLGPCFEEFPGEGGWKLRSIGQFQHLSKGCWCFKNRDVGGCCREAEIDSQDLREAKREPITSMNERGDCANLEKRGTTSRRAAEGCDLIR
jgi:hypothetical protein